MNAEKSLNQTSQMTVFDKPIVISWRSLAWILVFVFIIFTRFHHLGDKPYHHDESLYAKYMWNFHVGMGYEYDPMQHGPFMFHMQQVSFFLFGITNYTVRILPAATGIVIFFLMFLLRNYLPKGVAFLSACLFALDSVFMYFQRFNREDPYFSMASLGILTFLIMYYKDRKPWQAYAAAASVSILFCVKENAFVTVFIFFSFGFMKVITEMFQKENGSIVGLKAVGRNIEEFPLSAKAISFITLWGLSFIAYAVGNQFLQSGISNWDSKIRIYWFLVFVLMGILTAFYVVKGEKAKSEVETGKKSWINSSFYLDGYVFAFCVIIFVSIFILLYTTFFFNKEGFWGGIYKWYTYWLHQHSIARIRGPFHYYHHLMLIYALIPMSVVLVGSALRAINKAGIIISTSFAVAFMLLMYSATTILKSPLPLTKEDLFTNEHLILAVGFFIVGMFLVGNYIKEKLYLKGLLTWWSLLSYLVYSYLQEKVPWLVMHIITPMIILAAILLVEIFKDKTIGWTRNLVIVLFALMLIYTFHTSIQVCWYHEADPTEQLVYVQTTYEALGIIDELEEIGFWTNQGKEIPILIDGHSTWPFYWYLRDWKNVGYGKNVDINRHLVVICNWEDRFEFNEKMSGKYVARKYGLRAWYLPKRTDFTPGKWLREAFRWVLLRERFKPSLYGSQEICMFVREDVAKLSLSNELGEKPVTPKKIETAEAVSSTEKTIDVVFGRFGTGQGLFNEPKGVAADREGNAYVVDMGNNRIQKFDSSGKFLLAWGSTGEGDGQFKQPTGIAIDGLGFVYVADTWNHRIQKFDSMGKFIMKFGDTNTFWAPKDIVVDKEGFIYVVNTGFHRIHKFDKNGGQLWTIGTKGEGTNQFQEPVGIDIDSVGRVFVADTANQRVCIYDKDGHFLKQFQIYGWEFYYTEPFLSIDQTKNLIYLTDSRFNRIEVFDLDGNIKYFWGKEGAGENQFKFPIGIEVENGKIYVVDSMNHRIQVFKAE